MLILFALLLVPLVLMLALVVDLGVAYAERRQVQNVADSGAQAGTAIVRKHRISGNSAGVDAEVQAAIRDVASRSSGGLGSFVIGPCTGSVATPEIFGEYVDWYGTAVGQVGGGDLSSAYGVRLAPCKEVPTHFAKILGPPFTSVRVSATAAWVFGVIDGIDPNNPGYGPFAVWYGDTTSGCLFSDPHCIKSGHTVIFRDNDWCDDPDVSSDASRAPGGNMACDSNNFKGDIDHGQGFVNVGTETSNGGNALGQYRNTLEAHKDSQAPMLFPLISKVTGGGNSVELEVEGYACVQIMELGGGSSPYKAKVLAVGDDDFNAAGNEACLKLLKGISSGSGTVKPTSITVMKALE